MNTYEILENGAVKHTCGQIGLAKLYARRIWSAWIDSGFSLGSVKIVKNGKVIVAKGYAVTTVGSL